MGLDSVDADAAFAGDHFRRHATGDHLKDLFFPVAQFRRVGSPFLLLDGCLKEIVTFFLAAQVVEHPAAGFQLIDQFDAKQHMIDDSIAVAGKEEAAVAKFEVHAAGMTKPVTEDHRDGGPPIDIMGVEGLMGFDDAFGDEGVIFRMDQRVPEFRSPGMELFGSVAGETVEGRADGAREFLRSGRVQKDTAFLVGRDREEVGWNIVGSQ